MLRVARKRLHPAAQLRLMNTKVLGGLYIGHAALLDQLHSLKLELPRKLPSLHGAPPVPSKHLTRCLRNRVQANSTPRTIGGFRELLAKGLRCALRWRVPRRSLS